MAQLMNEMQKRNISYLALLNEYSQAYKRKYTYIEPVLNLENSMYEYKILDENNQVLANGLGKSKKESKQLCARNLIEKLIFSDQKCFVYFKKIIGIKQNDFKQIVRQTYNQETNYKGILNQQFQSKLITQPQWNIELKNNEYTIQCQVGQFSTIQTGSSKKKLKNLCAYQILNQIVDSEEPKPRKKQKQEENADQTDNNTMRQKQNNELDDSLIQFSYFRDIYQDAIKDRIDMFDQGALKQFIANDLYDQLERIIRELNVQVIKSNVDNDQQIIKEMGSYCYKCLRQNKPVVDLFLYVQLDKFSYFIKNMIENSKKLDIESIEKDDKAYTLKITLFKKCTYNKKQENFILMIYHYEIKNNEYYPFQLHYSIYMHSYNELIQKNQSIKNFMILIRRWRQDAQLTQMLPIEILDFITIQITNKFTNILPCYILFNQFLHFLSQNTLKTLFEKNESNLANLNPAIVSITELDFVILNQIQDQLDVINKHVKQWNNQRIQEWIQKILDE